jgi:flagellar hook protein FlgE
MIGTIYKGLTGLIGFSKGLDVLGNNIANLNTPGFKGSESSFRDLFYRYSVNGDGQSTSQIGQGVDASSTHTRFRQGELRDTGNPLDIAIDGSGFLILRQDGENYYTRAGQLEFNHDGLLVDRTTGGSVQSLTGSLLLQDINIASLRSNPPQATSRVEFTDNMTRTIPTTGPATHQITGVTVYDSAGTMHTLTINFVSTTPGIWTLEVLEPAANPTAVIGTGEIRYQGNGTPELNYNMATFNLAPAGTTASTITLFFGEPGTFSWTTGFSGSTTSDAQVSTQDGYAVGSMTEATFSENGTLTLSYSNGQITDGPRLALAWFNDLQRLEMQGNSLFANNGDEQPILGHAAEGVMGQVVAEKIELSNVELTEQFTDMVIIQRGYQASSQITTVANEMIQQLFEMQGRK